MYVLKNIKKKKKDNDAKVMNISIMSEFPPAS